MGYMISAKGELCEVEFSCDTIEKAIDERLDRLKALVPDGYELELDYREEEDVWQAMRYSSDLEAAFGLDDKNGDIIAFQGDTHDYGLDFDTVETALYNSDIPYVA